MAAYTNFFEEFVENESEKALDIRDASCKDGYYIATDGSCKKEEEVQEIEVEETEEVEWDVGQLQDYFKLVLVKESGRRLVLNWKFDSISSTDLKLNLHDEDKVKI